MNEVLILGNPNSGKSLLFNRLTGLSQKVANFPGVTVEVRSGQGDGVTYRDFPGIYSLSPLTKDEVVAVERFRESIRDGQTRTILYVMDATRFERSLYLLLQLLPEARAARRPVVVAMNVIDELACKGARIDAAGLARELGATVIPVSAKTEFGMSELREAIRESKLMPLPTRATEAGPVESVEGERRALARRFAETYGPQTDLLIAGQNRLDAFFLSTLWGPFIFFAIMLFLFQSIFTWSAPFMDFISSVVEGTGGQVAAIMPPGIAADFVKDALFGGIGSFLVFAPQIFVLFVIIGLLEDSGYLARASIMFHRPLSFFGLTGRSFVPLLSGHACAIPAIMATRTIESPRRRLLTTIAIPFMACSARLPVYAVLIAGFVPAVPLVGRVITLQGFSFFLLYAIGLLTGLLAAGFLATLTRTKAHAKLAEAPFVVELPPYRLPAMKPILKHSFSRTKDFMKQAGGIIFAVTVGIWFLGYFPNGAGHLESSYLGRMGHAIEGVFTPMGMDWKIGVGVLTSFLAREVFVGTMGTLYGIENAGDNIDTLTGALQNSGMTLAAAAALLVFYALSMQCVSTLAVMKKETGSWKVSTLVFVGMTLFAYAASMLTYHSLR